MPNILMMLTFNPRLGFLCLFATLSVSLTGCVDTSKMTQVVIVPRSSITFLLIDNSLSYNNPKDAQSQKVVELVRLEIANKLAHAKAGEHYIVRTIQSESNQLSAMISHLNLARNDLYFMKPKPNNPIELKVWEKEKREFEMSQGAILNKEKEAAIVDFGRASAAIFAKPSQQTDFIGALLTCQRFFEKQDYDTKRLVIYSDMVEDAALEDESLLDLSGVEVEARFVTKPASVRASTHQYFKSLETKWNTKLNADRFELYEVQNSF